VKVVWTISSYRTCESICVFESMEEVIVSDMCWMTRETTLILVTCTDFLITSFGGVAAVLFTIGVWAVDHCDIKH
jgi:hypothetical protein